MKRLIHTKNEEVDMNFFIPSFSSHQMHLLSTNFFTSLPADELSENGNEIVTD